MASADHTPAFTLGRGPYWVFLAASIATASLTPLVQATPVVAGWLGMSALVAIIVVIARLRDTGVSAWFAPIALLPIPMILLGVSPGARDAENTTELPDRLLRAAFASILLIATIGKVAGAP